MGFKKREMSQDELDTQIAKAKALAKEADVTEPRAKSVSFDESSKLVVIALKNGTFFSFPPSMVEELQEASAEDLNNVWIDESGGSVHWDNLDADFDITSLVAGIFGTKAWMSELGKRGGKVTSLRKAEASRSNGKKGGRPPKKQEKATEIVCLTPSDHITETTRNIKP